MFSEVLKSIFLVQTIILCIYLAIYLFRLFFSNKFDIDLISNKFDLIFFRACIILLK